MAYFNILPRVVLLALIAAPLQAQDEEGEPAEAAPVSRYVDLKPAFVVNYGGPGSLRYLKTGITLRIAGGEKGQGGIRHHMPYIRHSLVMLLTKASDEDISSMEGRELLRADALEAVREILMQEEGEQYVQDLLFSSFVVQK